MAEETKCIFQRRFVNPRRNFRRLSYVSTDVRFMIWRWRVAPNLIRGGARCMTVNTIACGAGLKSFYHVGPFVQCQLVGPDRWHFDWIQIIEFVHQGLSLYGYETHTTHKQEMHVNHWGTWLPRRPIVYFVMGEGVSAEASSTPRVK